jgi:hypothetical protein
VIPAALAVVFYYASVYAYEAFRERIVCSVDLFRLVLLKELGLRAPLDRGQEKALWSALSRFFVNGVDLDAGVELIPPR